jgi:hyperosmotically inducible periplasmic protein
MRQMAWKRKLLGKGVFLFVMSFGFIHGPPALHAQSSKRTPTAGDQSNDEASLRLAARIRRALVKDKNLSVRAHNITVVVKGGTVTLRGMVDSSEEKRVVHQKVEQIAGSVPVHDLLTVKQ